MRFIPRPLFFNVATGASPGAPLARHYSTTRCPSTCSNITQARPAYGSCSPSAESEMKRYGRQAPCFDTSQLVLSDTGVPQELNHYIVTRMLPTASAVLIGSRRTAFVGGARQHCRLQRSGTETSCCGSPAKRPPFPVGACNSAVLVGSLTLQLIRPVMAVFDTEADQIVAFSTHNQSSR